MRERSWWGWGYDGEGLADAELDALARTVSARFALDGGRAVPPEPSELGLGAPRLEAPPALAPIADAGPRTRAAHSLGGSYRDVVRALRGQIDHPPDVVVFPRDAAEVAAVLDWCSSAGAAVIPYGGGSSVVGGVEPDVGEGYAGVVSLDTTALRGVVEVDAVSRAARIRAGTLGPDLEDGLRPHGLTLRHFPQSFECSTLGGWIATRAGGHFATGPTHIDDLVESMEVVTPAGTVQTRRLPASGAGPAPHRLFLGSEGALGVVTEAWMRVRPRPRWRAAAAARFSSFGAGSVAVRALAQSGLQPSNCRLVDPLEALVNGAGDGRAAVLLVAFESAEHPVDAWAASATECLAGVGGMLDADPWAVSDDAAAPPGATGAWRRSFMRAPYLRDGLVRLGVLCETFETAVTWDRFDELHHAVTAAVRDALAAVGAGEGAVTCRLTHAYPDGAAPYFTVLAPARRGDELSQWATVKEAATDALLGAGGTVTHHHAVGRDHRPFYDRQRPALFAQALGAAKRALDPAGVLNPGVLVDGAGPGPAPPGAPPGVAWGQGRSDGPAPEGT